MAVRALGLSTLVLGVAGHGAVAFPRPRNAIDAETQFGGECYSSANPGGKNGQACFWFNNGCSIGCDRCDGTHNSAGPSNDGTVRKFLYKNMTKAQLRAKNLTIANAFVPAAGDMTLDPTVKPAPAMTSSCGKLAKPTICDPRLRTVRGRSTGHSSHCVCVCVCVCLACDCSMAELPPKRAGEQPSRVQLPGGHLLAEPRAFPLAAARLASAPAPLTRTAAAKMCSGERQAQLP